MKLYFGHPVNTYGTDLERYLIGVIGKLFPGWDIENPNQPKHQEGYMRRKETGNGMAYFFEEVLPFCGGGIFLPFRDGAWGAGVYGEGAFCVDRSLPVWGIDAAAHVWCVDMKLVWPLTKEETMRRVRTATGEPVPY